MEVATEEAWNPIKQDTNTHKWNNKEQLRCYGRFPLFNYGMLPQTWENSTVRDRNGFEGDDDPLDIVELSRAPFSTGDVKEVKLLGALELIDQNELDWKILTIEVSEAQELNIETIEDWEKLNPGRLEAIKRWFEYIKVFDGKSANKIESNRKVHSIAKTLDIVEENANHYSDLVTGKVENKKFWIN